VVPWRVSILSLPDGGWGVGCWRWRGAITPEGGWDFLPKISRKFFGGDRGIKRHGSWGNDYLLGDGMQVISLRMAYGSKGES